MRVKSKGTVYLVGAGPGDAGLLTLRGAELLQRADVVVYDLLVNPALLRLARPGAEIISRGKRTDIPQEEITSLIIEKARAGKTVVRLKGGDPYIFGRGGEEAEALAAAKISFEVVPGISSIVAAANYAGIPITHRDHCSSFTVFTGHESADEVKTNLRYEQIAKIPGTKVVLMGMDHLCKWTESLVAHGMSPETPVAMVRWGTRGKQKSVSGTLATIAKLAMEKKLSPPVITIIGDVVKLRGKLNWFENLPLFGKNRGHAAHGSGRQFRAAAFGAGRGRAGSADNQNRPADPERRDCGLPVGIEFLRLARLHQCERRGGVF